MASLILGAAGADTIRRVSETLKRRTRAYASSADGFAYRRYTPWLCARPVLGHSLLSVELATLAYQKGEVMIDSSYLSNVSRFLEDHADLTLNNLIGTQDDWAILLDPLEERPEMVVELRAARDLMTGGSRYLSTVFRSLAEIIVPLRQPRARGWTCQYFRGVVFLGFAPGYPKLDLAMDLAHELGHQALALFQSADRILASNWDAPVYSEVRQTNRPAIQSLHAVAAIAFMLQLAKDLGIPDYVHPEFNDPLGVTLDRGLRSLRRSCTFTELGGNLMRDFEGLV
jgi:hypothetical protein